MASLSNPLGDTDEQISTVAFSHAARTFPVGGRNRRKSEQFSPSCQTSFQMMTTFVGRQLKGNCGNGFHANPLLEHIGKAHQFAIMTVTRISQLRNRVAHPGRGTRIG